MNEATQFEQFATRQLSRLLDQVRDLDSKVEHLIEMRREERLARPGNRSMEARDGEGRR